jgi:hypothetical protein
LTVRWAREVSGMTAVKDVRINVSGAIHKCEQ